MAGISKAVLRKKIADILKDDDISAEKVRKQLEEDLDTDLLSRKKEIEALVKEITDSNATNGENASEDEEEEEEDDEPVKKKGGKRGAATSKKPAKKVKKDDSEDVSEEDESDEEFEKKSKPPKTRKLPPKKKRGTDSDSDDWKKSKGKKGGGAKKGSGYTKTLKLSPELAALVGQDSMARHEVVKKVWAIIKERNLYDAKNKQYAICDDALFKVIGIKRFRTFGMMKYLKNHFIV